jgi:hypothetical protein
MEYWKNGIMMNSQKVVSPVKTGVQGISKSMKELGSGFRRNDDHWPFSTFYDFINNGLIEK